MAAEFDIFSTDEEAIVRKLDDDLFFKNIEKLQLEQYAQIVPTSEVDSVVKAALPRALTITITDGRSGIIHQRRKRNS